jgi:hypothetical protein
VDKVGRRYLTGLEKARILYSQIKILCRSRTGIDSLPLARIRSPKPSVLLLPRAYLILFYVQFAGILAISSQDLGEPSI